MAGRKAYAPLVVEEFSKQAHIGWARSIVVEWDPVYGLEPVSVDLDDEGRIAPHNFADATGYALYLQRVMLSKVNGTVWGKKDGISKN